MFGMTPTMNRTEAELERHLRKAQNDLTRFLDGT